MHVICVILTLSEQISRGGNVCNIDFVEKISRGGNACNICYMDFVEKISRGDNVCIILTSYVCIILTSDLEGHSSLDLITLSADKICTLCDSKLYLSYICI